MAGLVWTQSGIDRLMRDFTGLATLLHEDRRSLLRAVDQVARPSIARNFEAGGRPDWQADADATVERKGSDRPLIDTGAGMEAAGARARWTITRDAAMFDGGSFPARTDYMALHQRGDEQLNVDLPARPYADIPDEDKPKLDALLWRWTDRQCRRNGL